MPNYALQNTISFRKTTKPFGELSNMCRGFPLRINDVLVASSEHLYQAIKIDDASIQRKVLFANNAYIAKQVAYEYKSHWHKDWEDNYLRVMWYSVVQKYLQNQNNLNLVLDQTKGKQIVELVYKPKDPWGAIKTDNVYVGRNLLGRIWMAIREHYEKGSEPKLRTLPEHYHLLDQSLNESSS